MNVSVESKLQTLLPLFLFGTLNYENVVAVLLGEIGPSCGPLAAEARHVHN